MHALVKDGSVVKYPYTIGMLRKDNPNTSFPKRPTNELLQSWGMEAVTKVDRPDIDYTKNINEGTPVLINGQWTQVWNVTDAPTEEVVTRIETQSQSIRSERDNLLAETDWLVIYHTEKGTNIPMEWEAYRQALRDVPNQDGFPFDIQWPTKPE